MSLLNSPENPCEKGLQYISHGFKHMIIVPKELVGPITNNNHSIWIESVFNNFCDACGKPDCPARQELHTLLTEDVRERETVAEHIIRSTSPVTQTETFPKK